MFWGKAWARPQPGVRDTIQVFYVGGNNEITWAFTQRTIWTGNWNLEKKPLFESKHSAVRCRNPNQHLNFREAFVPIEVVLFSGHPESLSSKFKTISNNTRWFLPPHAFSSSSSTTGHHGLHKMMGNKISRRFLLSKFIRNHMLLLVFILLLCLF